MSSFKSPQSMDEGQMRDLRWARSDWPACLMYPMRRLLLGAIQQPGAAERTLAERRFTRRTEREQAASAGTVSRILPARASPTGTHRLTLPVHCESEGRRSRCAWTRGLI
ncbi:unnamed protein product [Pleuronectes platessa]|uniref:Uncharacterized protein n=1 Tax=Pleuronectes platessa TaxID=8262 RepID=A0A9N7UBW1_PLEPL|nr:unnamed protein product [Pleuronectes platessa]